MALGIEVRCKNICQLAHLFQRYFQTSADHHLVGGLNPSEKYESQWGWDYPIYEMENKKCSEPPNSDCP